MLLPICETYSGFVASSTSGFDLNYLLYQNKTLHILTHLNSCVQTIAKISSKKCFHFVKILLCDFYIIRE